MRRAAYGTANAAAARPDTPASCCLPGARLFFLAVSGRTVRRTRAHLHGETAMISAMQRNMDLARKILIEMESHDHGRAPREFFTLDEYAPEQIGFHIWLLGDAGLIVSEEVTGMLSPSPEAIPINLTWAGYEFLDAARSDGTWNKALTTVKSSGVSVTFDLLKQVCVGLAKAELAKHGITLG